MLRQAIYNLLNLASRLLNFVLYWTILNRLGASAATDWFFFVYGGVYFLIVVTFYGIECALVPLWHQLSDREAGDLVHACGAAGLTALLLLPLVGAALIPGLGPLMGFPRPLTGSTEAVVLMLLMMQPPLAFAAAVLCSRLQTVGRYFWPITHLTWRTAGVLAVLWLPGVRGIWGLAVAYCAGEVVRLAMLNAAARDLLPRRHWRRVLEHKRLRQALAPVAWMVLMVAAFSANPYVDFLMVGSMGGGAATLVEYCGRLRGLPLLALNGMMVVWFGDWAREHGTGLSRKTVLRAAVWGFGMGGAMAAVLFFGRPWWLPWVFTPGAFTTGQLRLAGELVGWYLVGTPFVVAMGVLSRGLLVVHRYRRLAFISLLSVAANAVLNLTLLPVMGLTGVAVSTVVLDLGLAAAFLRQVRTCLPTVTAAGASADR